MPHRTWFSRPGCFWASPAVASGTLTLSVQPQWPGHSGPGPLEQADRAKGALLAKTTFLALYFTTPRTVPYTCGTLIRHLPLRSQHRASVAAAKATTGHCSAVPFPSPPLPRSSLQPASTLVARRARVGRPLRSRELATYLHGSSSTHSRQFMSAAARQGATAAGEGVSRRHSRARGAFRAASALREEAAGSPPCMQHFSVTATQVQIAAWAPAGRHNTQARSWRGGPRRGGPL